MKLSKSLTVLLLPMIYLWMINGLAASTADCVDCDNVGTPGVTPAVANARELSSTITKIDGRAINLGCSSIRTNRNFNTIRSGLKFAGYTPEEFFKNATCKHHLTANNLATMTPLQLALREPISRRKMITQLLSHLDSLDDELLVRDIINQEVDNMTTLDYLDDLYKSNFSKNKDAKADLDYLRSQFCKRGGIYRIAGKRCPTKA